MSRWNNGRTPARLEGRVVPAAVGGVLMLGVVAVLDQEGGAVGEPVSGDPASREPGVVIAERRVVVGR
jgi:hypothetical protein